MFKTAKAGQDKIIKEAETRLREWALPGKQWGSLRLGAGEQHEESCTSKD